MIYNNIFRKNYLFLIRTILIIFLFSSCHTDDDLSKYYQGSFNDSVIIISESDTVNIVLEQARTQFHKEIISYSIETNGNTDSITLKLFVSFGSYDQNPKPVKDINEISDTLYVFYSLRNKIEKVFQKNNSITGVNTSPAISYVSIDSVAVQKGTNKYVTFVSRLTN